MADEPRWTRATDAPEPRKGSLDDTMPAPELTPEPEAGGLGATAGLAHEQPPADERYRFGAELGRGGMGRVVEAFDTHLGRTVAFKEVLPKGGAAISKRFRREVQITARLEHASIVPLYDAGTMPDGRPFYVMRRVSGRPLDELVARARDLSERLALLPNVLAAIDAIAHAHKRGVIHRDLKPSNILVGELGETVVIDWGLAKVIGEDDDSGERAPASPADSLQTQVGSVFGTPGFMAPEQARGDELGPGSDVFALGATLYQVLAGRPPLAGDSATHVIEKTLRHAITPLDEACPGAPPELVAIVGKALAHDPAARYRDAGALAEDVRRFHTGQLVAAHRYTRRQRLARFARRHRAPLSVAALASVAVAALAWFSVHRILEARDAANDARAVAELRRRDAEQARDKLSAQYDAFVVERARDLVDKNPTEAIAVLKQLAPSSQKLADARAIAKAAVLRGVAWGLPLPQTSPMFVELDPDCTRLVVGMFDGEWSVWDLDARKRIVTQQLGRDAHVRWIRGGRLLVARANAAPRVFDPATGQSTELAAPAMRMLDVSDDGTRVAYVDATGHAGVLDVATGQARTLAAGGDVESVAIAPGGSAAATIAHGTVTIFDAAGTAIAHRDGNPVSAAFSRGGEIAVLDNGKPSRIFWMPLADPTWRELAIGRELPAGTFLLRAFYRGDELQLVASGLQLLGYVHGKLSTHRQLKSYGLPSIDDAGDGVTILPGPNGTLSYHSDFASGDIPMPTVLPGLRLAARHGKSRLVAAGAGALLVYDLDAFLPRRVPVHGINAAAFVDDSTLALRGTLDLGWRLVDLRTGQRTEVEFEPYMLASTRMQALDHRLLVTTVDVQATGQRRVVNILAVLRAGSPKVERVVEAPGAFGALVPGDAIAFTAGDEKLLGAAGNDRPHELARLDSKIVSIAGLGHLRFAAVSARGELVRGTIDGPLEHARIDSSNLPFVGGELDGAVLVAVGSHLFAWDRTVHEIARLKDGIAGIAVADGGAVLMLDNHESEFLPSGPAAQPRPLLPPMQHPPQLGPDGRTLVAEGVGGQVEIVDLPSSSRWSLPVRYEPQVGMLDVSQGGRLVQGLVEAAVVWTLPQPSPDLAAWLDELTDATEPQDVLTWPWQQVNPP